MIRNILQNNFYIGTVHKITGKCPGKVKKILLKFG
jgi:hypothetical protein